MFLLFQRIINLRHIIFNQCRKTGHLQLAGIQRVFQLFRFFSNLFFRTVQFPLPARIGHWSVPHRMMETPADRAWLSFLQLLTKQQHLCGNSRFRRSVPVVPISTAVPPFLIFYFIQQLTVRYALRPCHFQIGQRSW